MNESYDLIIYLLQKYYPERNFEDMDDSEVYEWFYDHYGITDEDFNAIVMDLLPLCTIAKSELTNTWYKGFGTDNLWLLKKRNEMNIYKLNFYATITKEMTIDIEAENEDEACDKFYDDLITNVKLADPIKGSFWDDVDADIHNCVLISEGDED